MHFATTPTPPGKAQIATCHPDRRKTVAALPGCAFSGTALSIEATASLRWLRVK